MKTLKRRALLAAVAVGVVAVSGCAQMQSWFGNGGQALAADTQHVTLSGGNEVPAVTTSASATGDITVGADGAVSGNIKVTGMTPTAAHIHQGAPGANGPVIVPMVKEGADSFTFAPNAKMTSAQLAAFKAGNTYVNVHSAAHPGGEIRMQLKGS